MSYTKKIHELIIAQLKMGSTPQKLSQSLVAGFLIGVFPIVGITTLLAGLAAICFRLNHVVIQAANYIVYPLQIIMIPVYIKIVSLVFDVGYVPLRPDLIINQFKASPEDFLKLYGLIGIYATVVWGIISLGSYFTLYPITMKIVRRLKKQ